MSSNFFQSSDFFPKEKNLSSFEFRAGDGYLLERCTGKFWDRDGDVDGSFSISDRGGFCGSITSDVVDLLPADPFEMDVATTIQAITGCLDNFADENMPELKELETDGAEIGKGGDQLFAGLNLVCRGTLTFMPEEGSIKIDKKPHGVSIDKVILAGGLEEFLSSTHETDLAGSFSVDESQECSGSGAVCYADGGEPHDAFSFALGYLSVQALLSVERVCKSLNEAVKSDPLLWMDIRIDLPLSDRITDNALVKLTSRADGCLKSLTLIQCLNVTDGGLKCVVESNPGMTKLSVPGCLRISTEGILNTLKPSGARGIKQLRIGGRCGITNKEYEELKILLGLEKQLQSIAHKPRYYPSGILYLSSDDDRAIDIERCPRCEKLSLVYDCPVESCQKNQASQPCRACTLCIARCFCCGRCIYDCDYVETFRQENLCLDCWEKILNCQEEAAERGYLIF